MKKLLKPIKITTPPENVFIWGCLHLGHDPSWDVPLWKLRGFNSIAEHDLALTTNWFSRINEDSVLILAGDTMFGHNADVRLRELLTVMPYTTCYILPGNHTAGWRQLMQTADAELGLTFGESKRVYFCPNYMEFFIDTEAVVVSHYPILSFNGEGDRAYHFYAHVHNSLHKSEVGRMYLEKSHSLEVSVERYAMPPSFAELRRQLKDKHTQAPDRHAKNPT